MSILQSILENKGPMKKIGVPGMGYVGMPAAALFADADCFDKVLGFQRNSKTSGYKIEMLNNGENSLKGQELKLIIIQRTSNRSVNVTKDTSEKRSGVYRKPSDRWGDG